MATFARCTRVDGRQVYVNLDLVLSIERFPKINRTVLGLAARLLDGDLSVEVQEEPESLIRIQ
jgi:uncharacterized protein YlzI (FlbEa/FlbD family)